MPCPCAPPQEIPACWHTGPWHFACTLGRMLERAAAQQQSELDRRTAIALGLFEPLLILVMGGLVLVIVLAVLMPIIEINMLMH